MLSNQKIIDELKKITTDYINTRPKMTYKPFVSNKAERDYNLGDNRGGFKSMGQHPFPGSRSQTFYPDPLFGGAMYKTMADYNNRNSNSGGALLGENMPLTGGEHSDSDYYSSSCSSASESDSDSEYESESESVMDSECEGGNIYEDYVKPVAKGVYEIGKEIVVPVGKELLKEAILGLMMGAGNNMEGGLSGTKKEFLHILKAMYPKINFSKKSKAELKEEIKKVIKANQDIVDQAKIKTDNLEMQKKVGDIFVKKKSNIVKELKKEKKENKDLLKKIKPKPEPKKRGRKPKVKTDQDVNLEMQKKVGDMFVKTKSNIVKELKKEKKENKDLLKKIKPEPKKRGRKPKVEKVEGGKIKKIVGTKKGETVRGDIVKRYMKEHNVKLGEASKKVKELGLY
jgi:chaperonin cofactor prefoldin